MSDPDDGLPAFSYHRRRRQSSFDTQTRRIAAGAGAFAVLIIAVALLWDGIKPGTGFGPPPEIKAPAEPLRLAPANPGGLTVPGADQQIMSGQGSVTPQLVAPPPPPPDLSALQPPPPPPPPVHATPDPGPAASALAPPSPPPPMPASPVPANGTVEVQLAAAVDPAGAKAAWQRLNRKLPGLFAGRTPLYSHAKVAGVEFWRLRVGGFTDTAAAETFCDSVKAEGAACTVARF